MRKLTVGILAHVDAGKTTLSENMLYLSGAIRKIGRVDNKDAYLDNFELERLRGITIFSKQALMTFADREITLLDTPGHVDFSAEMERTLQVLDYAILVISASSGIQSHTRTVWELLKVYNIPTFIFINKMDQDGVDKDTILTSLQNEFGEGCISFSRDDFSEIDEHIALCDEAIMDRYIKSGEISKTDIKNIIARRKVFPVYFGSALRQEGVEDFLDGFVKYSKGKEYPLEFGAKVFKISRDSQGNRLTHIKITGGELAVKDTVNLGNEEEKINQIRIYSGEKYTVENSVSAGTICAVTGLSSTRPGDGIGNEMKSMAAKLESVLLYQVILPDEIDARYMIPKLREIEEEEPELKILWNEVLQKISIQVMGEVQLEILESIVWDRFKVKLSFSRGDVVYKETITNICEGVGHFEPLRHYAEVHLLLEAGKRGSSLEFRSDVSEDILEKNWQRLILSHLREKEHKGVLIGAHITDMVITLVTGRGHNKHTESGDFREATFRALRQGLKEAESIILEPYYDFRLIIPENMVGRAMTDISNMHGQCELERTIAGMALIIGSAPVINIRNYQKEVSSYSRGEGRISFSVKGYYECHNPQEVIDRFSYDSERDIENPTASVFCSKGTGFLVPWYEVKKYMHVESVLKDEKKAENIAEEYRNDYIDDENISLEEIDEIMSRTYYSNSGKKKIWKKRKSAKDSYYESITYSNTKIRNINAEEYLLVDGYNIIYDWEELELLAKENMEAARQKLIDILCDYKPLRKSNIMVVFDAYRVAGGKESCEMYNNISVVFTGEAQTADHFIEKFAYDNKKKYNITVATSDGLEQIIIRGAGANLLSANDLKNDINRLKEELRSEHLNEKSENTIKLEEVFSEEAKNKLKEHFEEKEDKR